MKHSFKFTFIALLALYLFCGYLYAAQKVDGIAAVVGDDIILLSEVYTRSQPAFVQISRAAAQQGGGDISAQKAALIKQTLETMIDETLITQQAKEMNITVTSDEVDMAIENMARENNMDMATFEKALEAQGMQIDKYRKDMRRDILKYKVLNLRVRGRIKIGDKEARQFFNIQVRDVRKSGYFIGAHILIRVPAGAKPVEVAKLRARALDIKAKIESGQSFAELAKKYSEDEVTAPYGGSLGKRSPGDIPRVLDQIFLDMEQGEIAGPVRTNAGFHILKMVKREDLGVKPFAEVKSKILNQLMQEEMIRQQKIWLKELRQKVFIDVRL
jgi:peptidyl-prolyl cis-trans isomerase SurA